MLETWKEGAREVRRGREGEARETHNSTNLLRQGMLQ